MKAHKIVRHWLLTAFDPFAGRKENNSQKVLEEFRKLATEHEDAKAWNLQFHYAILPVEYDRVFDAIQSEIAKLKKAGIELDGVLSLGEGSEEFKIETQGFNVDDVPEVADNAGVTRSGQKIIPEFAVDMPFPLRFPFDAFARIRSSTSAGFFICNHLCVRMSHHYNKTNTLPYFGFIHVPKVGSGGMFTPDVCAAVISNAFKKIPGAVTG